MAKVKFDLRGRDVSFLANCLVYHKGLQNLELYRSRSERVPSLEQLKEGIDRFQQAYEGGKNGDRIQIALRKEARKRVQEHFDKAAQFLSSVAQEEDVPSLRQAGLAVVDSRRKSSKRAPAHDVVENASMHEGGVIVDHPGG